ncbi:hypothetical protein C2E23DRAFT_739887, partial [Lenzites betulinus]
WQHLCKMAKSVQILHHENILLVNLVKAKQLLQEAMRKFKEVYVEQDMDCMHLMRPCIHTLWHAPDKIFWRSSLICCTQYAMERLISNLGAMISSLDQLAVKAWTLPHGAEALGDGFVLLHTLDSCAHPVPDLKAQVFHKYFLAAYPTFVSEICQDNFAFKARKWAQMLLPNGLVACFTSKECNKPLSTL